MQHVSWYWKDKELAQKISDNLSRSEVNHLIEEWIFNERDRAVLKRRLLDGIC